MEFCIISFLLHWEGWVVLIRRMINIFQIWVTRIFKSTRANKCWHCSFTLLEDKLLSFLFLISQCHNRWQGHSQVHVQVSNRAGKVCGSLCWFKGVDSAPCVTRERWPWTHSCIWGESRPKTVASLSCKHSCTDYAHIPLEVIRTSLALLLTTPAPLDLSPSRIRFHLKFGSSNAYLLSCVRFPNDVTISRSPFFLRWMKLLMYFRGVPLCLKFHRLNKFLTHSLTQSCWPALDLGSPLPGYAVCILWERSTRKEGRDVVVLPGSHTILIRCLFACLWSLFIS